MDGRTDGRTDGQMDRPSYTDAMTHLKSKALKTATLVASEWSRVAIHKLRNLCYCCNCRWAVMQEKKTIKNLPWKKNHIEQLFTVEPCNNGCKGTRKSHLLQTGFSLEEVQYSLSCCHALLFCWSALSYV